MFGFQGSKPFRERAKTNKKFFGWKVLNEKSFNFKFFPLGDSPFSTAKEDKQTDRLAGWVGGRIAKWPKALP